LYLVDVGACCDFVCMGVGVFDVSIWARCLSVMA
jgi:hypothetical protein